MAEEAVFTQISVLGPLSISGAQGKLTRFPTRKSQALFLLLLLNRNTPKDRDSLVGILWPRSGETSGRASLRQDLAVLRKALRDIGAAVPETELDGIVLRLAEKSLDLDSFDVPIEGCTLSELTQIASLYHGAFCDGFVSPTPAMDDITQLNRIQMLGKAIEVRLAILRHPDTLRDANAIIAAAGAVLQLDPAQENAHRALIKYYIGTGQAAKAQHQYQLCQNVLRTEFDAAPDAKTVALATKIKLASPASQAQSDAETPVYRSLAILGVSLPLDNSDWAQENPEDLIEQIEAFHAWVAETCEPFQGLIFQEGSGHCLVSFGHEHADEHDGERAVFAALKLAGPHSMRPEMSLSCAIDYGTAVVRKTADTRLAIDGAPVMTVQKLLRNIASPEIWASPSIVAVAPTVLMSLDTAETNVVARLGASRIIGISKVSNRFYFNRLSRRLTNFIGRESQLSKLKNCWQDLASNRLTELHIYGEAGIGKTRLLYHFVDEIKDEHASIINIQGSPHHSQIALFPFQQIFSQGSYSGIDLSGDALTDMLTDWCHAIGVEPKDHVSALQTLFGAGEGITAPQSNQKKIKQLKLELVSCIRAKLGTGRSCLVIEDLQWCDPSTRAFISELGEGLKDLPVLLVTTARSMEKNLNNDTVMIGLPRMNTYEAWDLITAAHAGPLNQSLLDRIIRRSDGVPLCLEELCKTADIGAPNSKPSSSPPMSMRASLFAQVDRLGDEREVLQSASIFERSFDFSQISSVCTRERNDLCLALNKLEIQDLIYSSGRPPHAHYEFKTTLIHEIVYETLPKRLRFILHERAARFFERRYLSGDNTMASVAAQHWLHLDRPFKVVSMSLAAAKHAILLSAHSEAIHHLSNAQKVLSDIKQPDRDLLEFDILSLLGPQMLASKGFADSTIGTVHDRLRTLATSNNANVSEQSLWGLWSYYIVRANLSRAHELAKLFRKTSSSQKADDLTAAADYMDGIYCFYCGQFKEALSLLEPLCITSNFGPHDTLILRLGLDVHIAAASYCGWIYALQNDSKCARDFCAFAINRSHYTGHDFSLAFSHIFAAVMELFLDQPCAAQPHASIAASLATEHGFAQILAHSMICNGRIADLGKQGDGLSLMKKGLKAYQVTGAALAIPYARTWIAQAYISRGHMSLAADQFARISEHMVKTGETYFQRHIEKLTASTAALYGMKE